MHPVVAAQFKEGHFLVKQEENRFSGDQENYLKTFFRVVKEAAEQIQEAIRTNSDRGKLFTNLLEKFGTERNHLGGLDINFGVRRDLVDKADKAVSVYVSLSLGNPYKKYGDILRDRLEPIVRALMDKEESENLSNFGPTQLSVELIPYAQFRNKTAPADAEKTRIVKEIKHASEQQNPDDVSDGDKDFYFCPMDMAFPYKEWRMRQDELAKYERINPEQAKWIRIRTFTVPSPGPNLDYVFWDDSQETRTHLVYATLKMNFGAKEHVAAHYLAWASQEKKSDRDTQVKRARLTSLRASLVRIVHLDSPDIASSLEDIQQLFVKIINNHSKNLNMDAFKKDVALFRYKFSFVMPFRRGSAAIGEMFESSLFLAIAQKHLIRKSDYLIDCEALTSFDFATFEKDYVAEKFFTYKEV